MPPPEAGPVPGLQSFETWRDILIEQAMPVEVRSRHAADFAGRLREVNVGAVSLLATSNSPVSTHRTRRLIRRSDPESYLLLLNMGATHAVIHEDMETVLRRGDMTVMHTSRVFQIDAPAEVVWQRGGLVMLDPSTLEIPPADLGRMVGHRLAGDEAVGKLASRHFLTLASVGRSLLPTDALRLGDVTLDLLAVVLGHHLRIVGRLSPQRLERERFARIRSFIRARLDDPGLTPEVIAVACHISVRTLHRLFEAQAELTVAKWIRTCRLERLRADLLDPRLAAQPVAALALARGFSDVSHATRAFKDAYEMSPAAYRAHHAAANQE